MVLPVIGQRLVELAILFLRDVVRVACPDWLRFVQLLILSDTNKPNSLLCNWIFNLLLMYSNNCSATNCLYTLRYISNLQHTCQQIITAVKHSWPLNTVLTTGLITRTEQRAVYWTICTQKLFWTNGTYFSFTAYTVDLSMPGFFKQRCLHLSIRRGKQSQEVFLKVKASSVVI